MLAKSVLVILYEKAVVWIAVGLIPHHSKTRFAAHFSMQQATQLQVTKSLQLKLLHVCLLYQCDLKQKLVLCSSGPLPVTKAHSTTQGIQLHM